MDQDWPYSDDDSDDGSDWDDDQWNDYEARLIDRGIREHSVESVRWALGTYGDAVTARVSRLMDEGERMVAAGLHGPAITNAWTAIELVVRYLVVNPLVQGAFLSDVWSEILTARVVGGKSTADQRLLPAVARMWALDLSAVQMEDGAEVWPLIVGRIRRKRNDVVHEGEEASEREARQALDAAQALLRVFVAQLSKHFGFEWPDRPWAGDVLDRDGVVLWRHFDPKSPFERRDRPAPDAADRPPIIYNG